MMVAVENVRSRFNSSLGLTSQGFKDRCGSPRRRDRLDLAPFDRHRRAAVRRRLPDARQRRRRRGRRPGHLAALVGGRPGRRRRRSAPTSCRSPPGWRWTGWARRGRRRESYVGPWLPEPLLTGGGPVASGPPAPEPDDAVELGEQVSLALLVVLETLSPGERAVFVLREVFGMSIAEVAGVTRPHRARRPADGPPGARARAGAAARGSTPTGGRSSEVTERFFAAVAGGDIERCSPPLAPDVVLISDGGGQGLRGTGGRSPARRRSPGS